jgi:hypothetical protein
MKLLQTALQAKQARVREIPRGFDKTSEINGRMGEPVYQAVM